MKALIVEDKEYIRKGLINLLQSIDSTIDIIGECESVAEAKVVTKTCQPELIFLDVNLTDGTAFDFLEQIETINFKIIFITAFEEYALKALKIGAADFLLKPVDAEELKVALQKVYETPLEQHQEKIQVIQQLARNENESIVLSMHDSYQVIDLNQLIYCESDKGYTTFYCTENKKFVVSKTLKEFEEVLESNQFLRSHQSFIVNTKFIDKYDKSGEIVLKNGKKIPVSTRKKESFLASFLRLNRFKGN